jgi:phosphoribosyl-ATP pyrophosphohydrolase
VRTLIPGDPARYQVIRSLNRFIGLIDGTKTGEEAIELVLAASREETASEAADLMYHLLVLLAELDIPFDDVIQELRSRG